MFGIMWISTEVYIVEASSFFFIDPGNSCWNKPLPKDSAFENETSKTSWQGSYISPLGHLWQTSLIGDDRFSIKPRPSLRILFYTLFQAAAWNKTIKHLGTRIKPSILSSVGRSYPQGFHPFANVTDHWVWSAYFLEQRHCQVKLICTHLKLMLFINLRNPRQNNHSSKVSLI